MFPSVPKGTPETRPMFYHARNAFRKRPEKGRPSALPSLSVQTFKDPRFRLSSAHQRCESECKGTTRKPNRQTPGGFFFTGVRMFSQ